LLHRDNLQREVEIQQLYLQGHEQLEKDIAMALEERFVYLSS
jgi:hypothetical protein